MNLSSSVPIEREKSWLGVGKIRERSNSVSSNGSFKLTEEIPKTYLDYQKEFVVAFQQSDHLPSMIALYSAFAGSLIGFGIVTFAFFPGWRSLGFYIGVLGNFHFLEYLTTAIYNSKRVKLESFLYDPVSGYHFALGISILEYLLKKIYYNWIYSYIVPFQVLGFIMVLIGQWFRSRAMIEANTSFNHHVQSMKDQDHHLITSGIFSIARHPSYLGFYVFTLGTQLVLFNPLCFAAFCFVLHQFFSKRIRVEEAHLIRFFGEEYKVYRENTPTYLPLIS